jgi:hypothetical protein
LMALYLDARISTLHVQQFSREILPLGNKVSKHLIMYACLSVGIRNFSITCWLSRCNTVSAFARTCQFPTVATCDSQVTIRNVTSVMFNNDDNCVKLSSSNHYSVKWAYLSSSVLTFWCLASLAAPPLLTPRDVGFEFLPPSSVPSKRTKKRRSAVIGLHRRPRLQIQWHKTPIWSPNQQAKVAQGGIFGKGGGEDLTPKK